MTGRDDVAIGWVRPGLVCGEFMDSLLEVIDADLRGPRRIASWRGVRCSANISHGRNELVRWMLDTDADWLLMVDTDMVFEVRDVSRLLEVADPDRVPVVGGLCFAQDRQSGRVWPTLFHAEPVGKETIFARRGQWPPNTVTPVGGTGAAFLLTHRRVFETMREKSFSAAYPWFQETENALGRVSEDLTFCARVADCGFPIHVHTGVRVGHVKDRVIGVDTFVAQGLGVDGG